MTNVVSEDSARRALKGLDGKRSCEWLKKHLKASYEPLLDEPWVLDIDSTVKLLYGHQEDAKAGYNPTKPGRPSHAFHSYFIAGLRMVVDVEVQAGNQTASSFAQPEMWSLLEDLKGVGGSRLCCGAIVRGGRIARCREPSSAMWRTCSN